MARARKTPNTTMPYPVSSVANGVSQQAPTLRLPNQVEEAINIRSTIIGGVGPRTGTTHVARFLSPEDTAQVLPIQLDRGDDGQYAALVTPTGIRVFNLNTGVEATVNYLSGSATWFTGTNPESDVSHVSAGNYVFLANRNKVPAMVGTLTPAAVNEGYFFARSVNYSDKIEVKITNITDGWNVVYSIQAPQATTSGSAVLSGMNAIKAIEFILKNNTAPVYTYVESNAATNGSYTLSTATAYTGIAAFTDLTAQGFVLERNGAVLRISRADAKVFKIEVTSQDVQSDRVYQLQTSVEDITRLPKKFWEGAIMRVSPAPGTADLDYWVKYSELDASGASVQGYYKECPAPATKTAFDATTMPYALQLTSPNVFSFDKVSWEARPIGSSVTIPEPSFIGSSIRAMYFTKGRLGFVLPDGTCTSRSDDNPFQFWRETSTSLLDTDPIDLLNGTEDVVDIHSSCLVGSTPVFWSATRQIALTSPQGQALSPRTAELTPLSAIQSPETARPASYGEYAYFATPGTTYTGLSQYSVDGSGRDPTGNETPVTDHIPAYIATPVHQIVPVTSEKLIFMVTSALRREVAAYQFLDTGQQGRVQSAWSRWVWDADCFICGMFIVKKIASMLIKRSDGYLYLEKMDLGSDRLVGPSADALIIDRKVTPSTSLDTDGRSFVTLPYSVSQAEAPHYYAVALDAQGQPNGTYPLSWMDDNTMKAAANLTGKTLVAGRAPKCYLEMSEPVAKTVTDQQPIYADATLKKIGPILGQSAGVIVRIGSKKRRNYARTLVLGQSLRRNGMPHTEMFQATIYAPGLGEYIYVLNSETEEKAPRRYISVAGRTDDILIAFENNGPLSFKVVGIVYMLSVTQSYTGL